MASKTLTDPLGRSFVLTDATWDRHILVNHPDMDGGRDFVEQAITSPRSIWTSRQDPDVRIYYGVGPNPGLLVVVKVHLHKQIVLTAHLAKRQTGGDLEWPQSV